MSNNLFGKNIFAKKPEAEGAKAEGDKPSVNLFGNKTSDSGPKGFGRETDRTKDNPFGSKPTGGLFESTQNKESEGGLFKPKPSPAQTSSMSASAISKPASSFGGPSVKGDAPFSGKVSSISGRPGSFQTAESLASKPGQNPLFNRMPPVSTVPRGERDIVMRMSDGESGFEDYEVDLLTDLSTVKQKIVETLEKQAATSSESSIALEVFTMTTKLFEKHEEKADGVNKEKLSEIRTVFELVSATQLLKSEDSLKIINGIYQSLVEGPLDHLSEWKERFLWHIQTSDYTSAFNELSNISSKDKAIYKSIIDRLQNDIIKPSQSYFDSHRVTQNVGALVSQRKQNAVDLMREVKSRGGARDGVAEIILQALEILSGDEVALKNLSGGSVLKQICLFFLFDNPKPTQKDFVGLKVSTLEMSSTPLDKEIIEYATESIQHTIGIIKKQYPMWLLQQFILISDLVRKPLFENEDEIEEDGKYFDNFLSFSHYSLVSSMIKSNKFLDMSIETFQPFLSFVMNPEHIQSLLIDLIETHLKVEDQAQVSSYKIVIQKLLKEEADPVIDLIHEKRGDFFFQSESPEGESNAIWELSQIQKKEQLTNKLLKYYDSILEENGVHTRLSEIGDHLGDKKSVLCKRNSFALLIFLYSDFKKAILGNNRERMKKIVKKLFKTPTIKVPAALKLVIFKDLSQVLLEEEMNVGEDLAATLVEEFALLEVSLKQTPLHFTQVRTIAEDHTEIDNIRYALTMASCESVLGFFD